MRALERKWKVEYITTIRRQWTQKPESDIEETKITLTIKSKD